MNRKNFLFTSAGFCAFLVVPGVWSFQRPIYKKKNFSFKTYRSGETAVPITQVTPEDASYVSTYYDVSSLSRSQRYLAVTKVPELNRVPSFGESVEVCVVDLVEQTITKVYTTKAWGYQVGANLEWGPTDRYLYTNDVLDGMGVCVEIDLETNQTRAFAGPKYNISPDGSCVVGFPLELLNVTQQGYGYPSKSGTNPKKLPYGASTSEGIWKTDLNTNERTLLVSLFDVASQIPEPAPEKMGTFYFWHTKFNDQGTRIMQVLRCLFPSGQGGRNAMVFTFDSDGTNIRYTVGAPNVWGSMGGHPNWHPDGVHLIRNIAIDGTVRFCQFKYDGTDFRILSKTLEGTGHPRMDENGRYLMTDSYPMDAEGRQEVAIRLIDITADKELILCKMPTMPRKDIMYPTLRLDGHPFWNKDYSKIFFQGAPKGRRQVFMADLSNVKR
ncbi:hypothetical protein [Flagellimonas sp.]|uniref:hypothetical protein n=1 Tax=Flagellimonas sp. TaxID=2058762 RepID=UPI003BB205B0